MDADRCINMHLGDVAHPVGGSFEMFKLVLFSAFMIHKVQQEHERSITDSRLVIRRGVKWTPPKQNQALTRN